MRGPVRRGQLIAPFGVGAVVVLRRGVSVLVCGLDHWFKRAEYPEEPGRDVNREEFRIEEPRLSKFLGVQALYLPPDHRRTRRGEHNPVNSWLSVPALRFPQWHVCSSRGCNAMTRVDPRTPGVVYCSVCGSKTGKASRGGRLVQARFIALCRNGHIEDFPWREWVHRTSTAPECGGTLTFLSSGGASLSSIQVKCSCPANPSRSLESITAEVDDGGSRTSHLSKELDAAGARYLCRGRRPWLHDDEGSSCGMPLYGSLLSATNVYFPRVVSTIYLPADPSGGHIAGLLDVLRSPDVASTLKLLLSVMEGEMLQKLPVKLREHYPHRFDLYTDDQMLSAARLIQQEWRPSSAASAEADGAEPGAEEDETGELALRVDEYRVLRGEMRHDELRVRQVDPATFADLATGVPFASCFRRVALVEKLRETRALTGFMRYRPVNTLSRNAQRRLLRKDGSGKEASWLPVYTVFGEGIFLELDEDSLARWEDFVYSSSKSSRSTWLDRRTKELAGGGWSSGAPRKMRNLVVHTLAHLLINRLVFDCGYSSAALRERLYVAGGPGDEQTEPMSGVLIYTAAGDAEGTMGGLVRMGEPGRLEHVIRRALEAARWCSADPVCMELGDRGGQGPGSCNLAACHSCALVPETSCEEFNRFLDRGSVIGTADGSFKGFFDF